MQPPTERPPLEAPLVTRMHDGNRQVIAAANRAALALGVRLGMALSHAQATVPGLEVAEADPEGDAAALRDLAARVTPDGLMIEAFGLADNLMLEGGVQLSGGRVFRGPGAFQKCLDQASSRSSA